MKYLYFPSYVDTWVSGKRSKRVKGALSGLLESWVKKKKKKVHTHTVYLPLLELDGII